MARRTSIHPLSFLRSIRRLAPAMVGVGVAVGLLISVGLSLINSGDSVEARALVAVQQSSFSLDELPDALRAVRETGVVEAQAAQDPDLGVSAASLSGTQSTIVVIRGTPLIQVAGVDADRDQAAAIANAVAASLTDVLNRSGALGVFELIEPATAERAQEAATLPLLPLAVFAGLTAAIATAFFAFVVTDPVYTIADLAASSEADIVEEVWLDPKPPIAGKVRSAALRLGEGHGRFRLIHAGWGDDMSEALEHLILKSAPDTQAQSSDEADQDDDQVRNIIVVMEGTPMRKVLAAEESLRTPADGVILVHPRLA